MIEKVQYCVINSECEGPSKLVDTCYGFTGGDKWRCIKCDSYVVFRANQYPYKPEPLLARV